MRTTPDAGNSTYMNARPEHALPSGEVDRQAETTNSSGESLADGSTREYTCLDCDKRLASFTLECPECSSRQFQTTIDEDNEPTVSHGTNLFETLFARFNPYIPR